MKPKHTYLLLGIVLLAVFFRFYLIKEMPGGLFPDEAANGLDINLMEQGQLQPFYERGNGREALFFYLLWASVGAFGRGAWQHHIVSALIGTLSVVGCFLFARLLFSMSFRRLGTYPEELSQTSLAQSAFAPSVLGTNRADALGAEKKFQLSSLANTVMESRATVIALLASFFMATSAWHVVLSRTAFRANLIPLITTFCLYFGLKIFAEKNAQKKPRWSILFGIFFALGFYTYIAYRIMVPVVAMLVLWPLIADALEKPRFSGLKKYFSYGVYSILFFALAFAPLAYYFYTHPGSFVGRSGQVSVFNPELNGGNLLGTVIEVSVQSILGYFTSGDLNWRHNISGFPFLSPIISPFFAIGLGLVVFLAIRYFFRPLTYTKDFKHFLLLGWFLGMLLPVITTAEGIPHGLRAIGTIPAVFIITAYGLYETIIRSHKFFKARSKSVPATRILTLASPLIAVLFIAALPLQTYALYFIGARNSPENFYAFRSDLTPVSEYLKASGKKETTYLILDKFSVQTVDYLTTYDASNPKEPKNQPYTQVDPEDSWQSPLATKDNKPIWTYGLKNGDKIVFTQSSIFDIAKFKQYHKNTRLVKEVRNKFGQAVMAVYEVQ